MHIICKDNSQFVEAQSELMDVGYRWNNGDDVLMCVDLQIDRLGAIIIYLDMPTMSMTWARVSTFESCLDDAIRWAAMRKHAIECDEKLAKVLEGHNGHE